MADNVQINPGTGVAIATDDVGGVQYQRIKLTDGTPDSSNHAVVDSSGALRTIDAGVNTSVRFFALALTTSNVPVYTGGANLANRVFIHMQNDSDVPIEFHNNVAFVAGTGTLIPSGQTAGFSFGPGITVYARAASGSGKTLRVIEMA